MRAERRYQLLEQARKERRARVHGALRDASRLPKLPSPRALAVLAAVVVAVVLVLILVSPGSQRHPALARSCTTPAIALTTGATGAGHDIGWAITGPDAGTYVVQVDSRTIATVAGLNDCRADGTLPPLTSGSHRVQLLRDGRPVATAELSP